MIKFNHLTPLIALTLIIGACSKTEFGTELSSDQEKALSKQEINEFVLKTMEAQNDVFKWSQGSDLLVWSAAVQSDSIVAVGYKPANEGNIDEKIHLIDVNSPSWQDSRNELVNFIIEETQKEFPNQNFDRSNLLISGDEEPFPTVIMKIFSKEIIAKLRQMETVRYVEPMSYSMEELDRRSDAGCGVSPDNNIPSSDFTTISPNAKRPWNFDHMNIQNAWNSSQGDNITICLIDTGTSPNQSKLGSNFDAGQSSGRFIDRTGTFVNSWWPWNNNPDGPNDQCGHGTQMAGLMSGPRAGGGSTVGVAYKSNLFAVRATGDVVINWWREKNGVRDALYLAGNRSDVKIISMSIGDIFYSSTVADGVNYAYNKGKLILAAAGTSTSFTNWVGVIFPASMDNTVGITGVDDGSNLDECSTCHYGSKVDFVAVMQRESNSDRTSLTLALSGNTPARVGGSSAATAITAGIAALVWEENPSQSRSQVLQKLKDASSLYPSRDNNFGWGLIDAAQAVN